MARAALVGAAFLALPSAMAAEAAPRVLGSPQIIGAPHYGDTLFNFYQDKTFDTLIGLMVSQHFARVAPHAEEAEVLRGGLLLSYGMHREATAVFARLIDTTTTPEVRDRAWYFLARAKQQRGLIDEAQEALSRVSAPLVASPVLDGEGKPIGSKSERKKESAKANSRLEDSRQLLQAQLLMAKEDYPGAAAVLQALQDDTAANGNVNNSRDPGVAQLARFNLGVAFIKNGDVEQGKALLDAVGAAPAANEEERSVRDRANLALGFAALQAKEAKAARDSLQRVRLNGLESNRALLGFGWAAAELEDYELALVPWQELAARPEVDAAVLEARLAVPYALAEKGAVQQALQSYEEAANGFDQESRRLEESVAAIRSGSLVKDLVALNPSSGLSAFANIKSLPSMPHATHLAPLLAGNDFQQAFKNLRDLQFLTGNLQGWQGNVAAYGDMLANRQLAFDQRLPAVRARAAGVLDKTGAAPAADTSNAQANSQANAPLTAAPAAPTTAATSAAPSPVNLIDLAALQKRRDALAAELARAKEDTNTIAFADAREGALMQRLARAQDRVTKIGGPTDEQSPTDAADRLRLASGALTWQLTQSYPARVWNATKGLNATDAALLQTRETDAKLAAAQTNEPERQRVFGERLAELTRRLNALLPMVTQVAQANQTQLQNIAIAELQGQQERLNIYQGQARLALAQIQDQAQFTRRPDKAAPP
jgi:chorismate mutase